MKKLSIIIPVYNAQQNISRCIESLLCQCDSTCELLLIDDGSKDNSLAELRKYQSRYPQIIRVIAKKNEGVAKTRNLGINEAKGEFICFVDNDDYVDDGYIKTYLDEINKSLADIVIGGYRRVEGSNVVFKIVPTDSKWFKFIVTAPWAKIFRTKFLLDNNIEFLSYGLGEDVYFSIMSYFKTNKIKVIKYIGYNWFFNKESLSNTSQQGFSDELDPIYLLDRIFEKCGNQNQLLRYFYVRYGLWYLLFSGKKAKYNQFVTESDRIFRWLNEHNIPAKFPLFSSTVSSDKFSVRAILNIVILVKKLGLTGLFAKFYCRG